MKPLYIGILLPVLPLLNGCRAVETSRAPERDVEREAEAHLVVLQNSMIVVGILPQVGGRVVVLRTLTGRNVLKSAPRLWNEPASQRIAPSPFAEWKAYYGQIVWLGPQSEWWIHQDLNAKRRADAVGWPPDPYLIYGDYKIEERQPNYIKLAGPDSPISGVRLEKELWIEEDGTVRFKATAINVSDREVTWDLWTNARMDGFCRAYVPVAREARPRIQSTEDDTRTSMPCRIADGFFTFLPETPPEGKTRRISKAFLEPRHGLIVGFKDGAALAICFEPLPREAIHREQANVELYNITTPVRAEALLELEHHAQIRTLKPGQSMETDESWRILDYGGPDAPADHIRFINTAFADLLAPVER